MYITMESLITQMEELIQGTAASCQRMSEALLMVKLDTERGDACETDATGEVVQA